VTRRKRQPQTYRGRTLTQLPTGEIECNGRRYDSTAVARAMIDAGLI
jgi:hypothetical protein